MKGLREWRDEIDRLDREVVALLNRRAKCVLGLAPVKRGRGMPVREPSREGVVLDNAQGANRGPLPDQAVRRIFTAVMQEMRDMQRQQGD